MLIFSIVAAESQNTTNDLQIDEIINSLTIEEKVGQLNLISIPGIPTEEQLQLIRAGKVGSVLKANGAANNLAIQKIAVEQSRMGIPILFQEDVIHGYRTIAPIPLAEAASWDLAAIKASAAVAARETSAAGIQLTYAPMLDIARDPRWGRIIEGAGEDPYLASLIATARVQGFQQNSTVAHHNILATAKHFAGYGASLAGRDYSIKDISERELREIHLPPFKAAIDAGVSSIMGAYTAYDGIPASANKWLMQTLLREELGFNGVLMTDWGTIPNLVKIGIANSDEDAAEQAFNTGFDIDMVSEHYNKILPKLVKNGQISETLLNESVRRVLRLKQKAGLLDKPYDAFDTQREAKELLNSENWQTIKNMALNSMVLLKNENNVLPISKKIKKIAVIGPMATAKKDLMGWWSANGRESDVVSILEGIETRFSKHATVTFSQGILLDGFRNLGEELIIEAVNTAKQADIVIAVVGEREWMSGEGGALASLTLPGLQENLISALQHTGKPIITVVVTGRPYILTNISQNSNALLQAWMPGTTGGEAVAEILAGDFNPSARLPITFAYHQGQLPIFYNYKATSHSLDAGSNDNRYTATYRDVPSSPLYPFGYGLSYTNFSYGKPILNSDVMMPNGSLLLRVKVSNTGKRAGRETVQLYLRDKVAQVTRPIKELKNFAIVNLIAGESQWVEFKLTKSDLSYIGHNLQPRIDAGEFILYVGPNSADLQELSFTLVK